MGSLGAVGITDAVPPDPYLNAVVAPTPSRLPVKVAESVACSAAR
jgi:hypothetical protein